MSLLIAARRPGPAGPVRGSVRAGVLEWESTNFRGRPVSLLAGPAVTAVALAIPCLGARTGTMTRTHCMSALAVGTAALVAGRLDDVFGGPQIRGLRGHLSALTRGEVTTGATKALVIGSAAAAVSARSGAGDWVVRTGCIAGTANLVNLLDVVPGRALKATLLVGSVGAVTGGGIGCTGVALASALVLPADLAERTMLGDAGANALGALLGLGWASAGPAPRRGLLIAVLALTLLTERVSLSELISRIPLLVQLDAWGRRPVAEQAG
jgi:hypothetical protein